MYYICIKYSEVLPSRMQIKISNLVLKNLYQNNIIIKSIYMHTYIYRALI